MLISFPIFFFFSTIGRKYCTADFPLSSLHDYRSQCYHLIKMILVVRTLKRKEFDLILNDDDVPLGFQRNYTNLNYINLNIDVRSFLIAASADCC